MKRIVRKNQIVITVLALLIAVAGYLNYMGNSSITDDSILADVDITDEYAYDISDEDLLAENAAAMTEGGTTENDLAYLDSTEDIASLDSDVNETTAIGEAVLTNTTVSNFVSEAKLSREQVRAKNKETLLEIIDNQNIADDAKQDAIAQMVKLTDVAEKEASVELLLEAKGFKDAVVSISDNSVDVVISQLEITDAQRAQIEDIVKRKAEVEAASIIITTNDAD